jgi:hypothetical protein
MEGRNCAADEAGYHQGSAEIFGTCELFEEIHLEFHKDRGVNYVTDQEGRHVMFGERQKQDFREANRMLTTRSVLTIFDQKRSIERHTDASSLDVRVILMQKQKDGDVIVVAYFSKQTKADQQRTITLTSWKR